MTTFGNKPGGQRASSGEHERWAAEDDSEPHASGEEGVSSIRSLLLVVLLTAALGAIFAAVSTYDFIQHLDRQVHSIHCSFIPGAGSDLGDSGCRTTMLSPYSSFFREQLWGGIPVSLWALAVFGYLAFRAALLLIRGQRHQGELRFLMLATLLPVAMSGIYGFLSLVELGATCKVCVGIYVASVGAFGAAFLAWRRMEAHARRASSLPAPRHAWWLGQGVGFVAALTGVFLLFTPSSSGAAADRSCGTLVTSEDPAGIMIPLTGGRGIESIEVLDPLCPACRAFDARLNASSFHDTLALKGVLFPLDSACNWMVTESLHPGACLVSEAILCANGLGDKKTPGPARQILRWSFENQDDLLQLARKDSGKLRRALEQQFPSVRGCLGGAAVRNKLTKSLRWAVANAVPVLTPQLFVGEKRLCDEDTDLGLEFTLRRMLTGGGLRTARGETR